VNIDAPSTPFFVKIIELDKASINYEANAVNGHGCFGNVCSNNAFSLAARSGLEDTHLQIFWKSAVKGQKEDVVRRRKLLVHHVDERVDFFRARDKDQDVAFAFLLVYLCHCIHGCLQVVSGGLFQVQDVDVEASALHRHDAT